MLLKRIIEKLKLEEMEKRRRIILIIGITMTIFLIVFLDFIHYGRVEQIELIVAGITITVLLVVLILLQYVKKGLWIFRTSIFSIGILFLYYTFTSANDGYSIIWSLTFPVFVFFLLGKSEGLVWLTVFAICIFFLLFTGHLFGGTWFGPRIQTRYIVTFLSISILSYGIESMRLRFEKKATS